MQRFLALLAVSLVCLIHVAASAQSAPYVQPVGVDARTERMRRREEMFQHRRAPRFFLHAGLAPVMVARLMGGGAKARFRERTFTLGLTYRQHFSRRIGLHAGVEAGVGASHTYYRDGGILNDEADVITRSTGPAYSGALEVAPVFGPFGAFYVAPGLVVRTLWPSSEAYVVERYSSTPQTHRFKAPLLMTGARLGFGVMLGGRHQLDLGWGVDFGGVLRGADRYFGAFLRVGYAFAEL